MSNIKESFHFMIQTLFHPIRCFYEMKAEKKGKMWVALLGMLLYTFTVPFKQQVTAFLFNPFKYDNPDLIFAFIQTIVVGLLFCVGNWSVTCLMEGEGKFSEIVMVFGYACYTIALIQVPVAIISNVCTFSEASLLSLLNTLAYVWFAYVLFFGIMTIHQFSLTKMLVTTLLTLVAIVILVFLYVLFFSFFQRIVSFIIGIYKELSFRLI